MQVNAINLGHSGPKQAKRGYNGPKWNEIGHSQPQRAKEVNIDAIVGQKETKMGNSGQSGPT